MKVFAVIVVARQIGGEYVFIRTEKAFKSASKADALLKQLKEQFVDAQGKPIAAEISTPQGTAKCYREVGAFELDLEE